MSTSAAAAVLRARSAQGAHRALKRTIDVGRGARPTSDVAAPAFVAYRRVSTAVSPSAAIIRPLRRAGLLRPPSRALLSTEPALSEDAAANDAGEEGSTPQKAASALSALPEGYTPGQALGALQSHAAGGGPVRLRDVRDLALSARPGYPRDASVVLTALRDFRRCNSFAIDSNVARVSMEAMHRAVTPRLEGEGGRAATPVEKVRAALFVLEAFADDKTGLPFAARTEHVDINLGLLLDAAVEAEEVRIGAAAEAEAEEGGGGEGEQPEPAAALAQRALDAASDVVGRLVLRGTHPERRMRKRAARRYLRAFKVGDAPGPTPRSADLGVRIALELGAAAAVARDRILTPSRQVLLWQPDASTVELLANKRKEEEEAAAETKRQEQEEEAAAAAEAAADAAAEAEEADTEGDVEEAQDAAADDSKKEQ